MQRFQRRQFLLASAALIAAPRARAEKAGKTYRVAFILRASPPKVMAGREPVHPIFRAFVHELRSLGYDEGRNLILERRTLEGKLDRYLEIFTDLARRDTQVIVTIGAGPELKRACDAVSPIPIVLFAASEPVKHGLAKSLAHPGGNVTGLLYYPGGDFEAKRFELLKEMVPMLKRASYLVPKLALERKDEIAEGAIQAARATGVELRMAQYTGHEFAPAFAAIERDKPDALFVSPYPDVYAYRKTVVAFARKARLPDCYSHPEFAREGGLMSYAPDSLDFGRRAALYVDKILKGARAGELPFERPEKFVFVVNLRTAKSLGIDVPRSVLLRADKVIE